VSKHSRSDGRFDESGPRGRPAWPHSHDSLRSIGAAATAQSPRPIHEPAPATGRHDRAVENTLEQADEAAASGDYQDALSWLGLIETIGDELPHSYIAKRQAWRAAIATQHLKR
jgi:hypothetical protein